MESTYTFIVYIYVWICLYILVVDTYLASAKDIFDDIPSASEVSRQKTKFEVEKDSSTEYKLRVKAEMTEYLPDAAASDSAGVAAASVRNEAAASSAAMVASAVASTRLCGGCQSAGT